MGKSDSEEKSASSSKEEESKGGSSPEKKEEVIEINKKEEVIEISKKSEDKYSDQDKKEENSLKRRETSRPPKRSEREDKSPLRRRRRSRSPRRNRRDSRSPGRRRRSRSPRRSSPSRNRSRSPRRDRRNDSSRRRRDDSPRRKDASPPRREKSPYSKKEEEPPAKKKKPDDLNTKTGGAYIHPAKLRMMQQAITDKNSEQFQRLSWEALKKSINGLINKVNVANIKEISREIFQENIVRGRGVMAQSIILAQNASPTFTQVYAALTSIINCRFPQNGELILRRIVTQFRRSYRRNIKDKCLHSVQFIAHLINCQVAHEILGLQILTLLLETPTDDSVEVAVGFLKEVGMKLGEVSPRGLAAVFERLRSILHEQQLEKRVQYMIEVMFAIRKDGFKEHPSLLSELDLVSESEQFTHMLTLDDDNLKALETGMNVFKVDPDFQTSEENYKKIKKDILDESSDEDDSSGSGDSSDSSSDEEEAEDAQATMEITDKTETNLVALRRTIYLAIQSSLTFEECAHKILKMEFAEQDYSEICSMIIDCCSQQRTYEKFFGLLGGRFCLLRKDFMEHFERLFAEQYDAIHRLETNKLRNVAKFFAHLLHSDTLPWSVLSSIHLSMDTTTSSSRIFIKILFQEIVEYMGITKLNERLKDETLAPFYEGLFPRDNPQNTRFAINFFTSIGLGGVTDELRDHLQTSSRLLKQKLQEEQLAALAAASSDDSSSDDSSSSSEEEKKKSKKRKKKSSKKSSKTSKKEKKKKKSRKASSLTSGSEEVEKKKSRKKKKQVMSSDDEKENVRDRGSPNRDKLKESRKHDSHERHTGLRNYDGRSKPKSHDKGDKMDVSREKDSEFGSHDFDAKRDTHGHDRVYNSRKHDNDGSRDNSRDGRREKHERDDDELRHEKFDRSTSPIVKRGSKRGDNGHIKKENHDGRKNKSRDDRHHENYDSRGKKGRDNSHDDYELSKNENPDITRKSKGDYERSRYDDAKNNRERRHRDGGDDHDMRDEKSRRNKNVIVRHDSSSDSSDQNEKKIARERREREKGRKRDSSSPKKIKSGRKRQPSSSSDGSSSDEEIKPPKLGARKVEVISIASKLRRPASSDSSDCASSSSDSSGSSDESEKKMAVKNSSSSRNRDDKHSSRRTVRSVR